MAMMPSVIDAGESGEVLAGDSRDSNTTEENKEKTPEDEKLVSWVISRVKRWKDHRNGNYDAAWNSYERLWRGIYSPEERTRGRERSAIISPALSEAVENGAAEIEEAVFGRGDFFDIWPEAEDNPAEATVLQKNEVLFREDLAKSDFTGNCSDVIVNGAVYGTGIAEILLLKGVDRDIKFVADAQGKPQVQVIETETERPVLRSVNPRNFVIDPAARGVDDALGVAIEEDVSAHLVREGIEAGDYNKVPIESGAGDVRTKSDPQVENPWIFDVVPVIRYYGKVPKHLLFPPKKTEDLFPDDKATSEEPVDASMVEAWVIIANEQHLLKAVETPDMMRDRPVMAYQWDIVPGRFWGRGVCEKGATPQKLLDAELRSRMDALAFVAAPMMAMDATKLPRGFKFEVYPGKNLLLSGDPSTILKPFKFGELDANSAAQVQLLDSMVQRATGSVDSAGLAQAGVSGQARSGAVSMSLSGIVKRNKRTLMRYIDRFLAPALRKLMWRYMQYDNPRYTPVNLTFNMSSTMGIMQREYEMMSLVQVLQSVQPGTTEHLLILSGIVSNSGMQGRDGILNALSKKLQILQAQENAPPVDPNAVPTDPVALQMQRMAAQLELAKTQAEIAKMQAQTRLYNAEAQTEIVEPQLRSQEIATKGIYQTPAEQIDAEFDRRMKIATLSLEHATLQSHERIADKQILAAQANEPKTETVEVPVPVDTGAPY